MKKRQLAVPALAASLLVACEGVIGLGNYYEGSPDSGARPHDATIAPVDGGADGAAPGDATPDTTTGDTGRHDAKPSCDAASCVAGQMCDTATGECVQCTSAAQCTSGAVCTTAACVGGKCSYKAADAGTPCNSGEGKVCTAAGTCGACSKASDCPAMPCYTVSCTSEGTCVPTPDDGKMCGDGGTCTGGSCITCKCEEPLAACKIPTCSGSGCGTANAPAGTLCDAGGGRVCSDAGTCVACNVANDCPPLTSQCELLSCTAHTCGETPAKPNTSCSEKGGSLCDDAGQCVQCTEGNLGNCDGGAHACTTTGTCVQCTEDSDCSGTTNYCSAGNTCVQCTQSSQCPLGSICMGGTCVL